MINRYDETWHRLREWTASQAASERLAAQILLSEGFKNLEPSHPLGGKDGKIDALCDKNGKIWIMAVYFPRGQKDFKLIQKKFKTDILGTSLSKVQAFAFVTNQELSLTERKILKEHATIELELYHLEKITTILDQPIMAGVRKQFLGIDFTENRLSEINNDISKLQQRIESVQTGGNTYCYWMLYHFDLTKNLAYDFVIIRKGEFPLYDIRMRILDMDTNQDLLSKNLGEMNSAADYFHVKWPLRESVYYRVFFHARNGNWTQDLILNHSLMANGWLTATRIRNRSGAVVLEEISNEFLIELDQPKWRP